MMPWAREARPPADPEEEAPSPRKPHTEEPESACCSASDHYGLPFQDEWLDAAREERHGRLRWLASDDGVTPSAAEARPPTDPEEEAPNPGKPSPQGYAAVGCTIGVWWIDDAQYYFGKVQDYDPDTSEIHPPLVTPAQASSN